MAELQGKLRVVYIATTGAITAATGTKINGVDNSALNRLADILDISQGGDTYKKKLVGLRDANASLSGNYDPVDAGQLALDPGDTVYVGFYPNGSGSSSGAKQMAMLVENFEESHTADGKQAFSCSLQANSTQMALPAQV